jgi:osmoprotectant transport system ATP-binding protein
MPEASPAVELRSATVVAANGKTILQPTSLSISRGEAVTVLGRSGAGKTTVLRLMNRLVAPTSGEVLRDGVPLTAANEVELRRRTGYVPQGAALFPHRSVIGNIATVPRLLGWTRQQIAAAARPLLDSLALRFDDYAQRFPRSLSGGEQQRVSIARALITGPSLLLCDEPFAALDPLVRREQQDAFIRSWREQQTTLVFVTHDVAEALRLGTRIVLIDAGAIVFDGAPSDFRQSGLPLVRRFVEATEIAS